MCIVDLKSVRSDFALQKITKCKFIIVLQCINVLYSEEEGGGGGGGCSQDFKMSA